jgi:hypothetical protein
MLAKYQLRIEKIGTLPIMSFHYRHAYTGTPPSSGLQHYNPMNLKEAKINSVWDLMQRKEHLNEM